MDIGLEIGIDEKKVAPKELIIRDILNMDRNGCCNGFSICSLNLSQIGNEREMVMKGDYNFFFLVENQIGNLSSYLNIVGNILFDKLEEVIGLSKARVVRILTVVVDNNNNGIPHVKYKLCDYEDFFDKEVEGNLEDKNSFKKKFELIADEISPALNEVEKESNKLLEKYILKYRR